MHTVEISDNLLSHFSASVVERDGSYVIKLPQSEVTEGKLQSDATYRIAVLPTPAAESPESEANTNASAHEQRDTDAIKDQDASGPPVEEGETRTVDIEDIGEQGDGVARVERGYVIIVPEVALGDTVSVEITHVRDNVAFAEVTESRDTATVES